MRIALITVALVLDALCMALMIAVFFITHPTPTAVLGIGIFAVVIVSNVPPLVWGLIPRKANNQAGVTAGLFE